MLTTVHKSLHTDGDTDSLQQLHKIVSPPQQKKETMHQHEPVAPQKNQKLICQPSFFSNLTVILNVNDKQPDMAESGHYSKSLVNNVPNRYCLWQL